MGKKPGYADLYKMWLGHDRKLRKMDNFGDVYWVDATDGLDTNPGNRPGAPFKSTEKALEECTDWNNDVIWHKGYEALDAGITVDVNKLSLLGWGYMGSNPHYPETGSIARTDAEDAPVLTVDAEFVEIAGLAFAAEWVTDGTAGQSALLVGNGANKAYIHNCFFPDWNIASQTAGLDITGAHYTVVEDCTFHSVYGNMDAGIYIESAASMPAYTKILGCDFMAGGLGGNAMANGIHMICAHQSWFIRNCDFQHVTNAVNFDLAAADLWGNIRSCSGSMTKGNFCTGSDTCDTIANAKANYEVILSDIWGSDSPMVA